MSMGNIPRNAKIFIAGHRGLVGSAIVRALSKRGYDNLLLRTREELDLRNFVAVNAFFEKERPEYIYLAAAEVGGILANSSYPVDFILNNLQIEVNVISLSYQYGVKKLLFLGSSCIYPKNAYQPMREDCLLTGPLEPTNQPYALAKIAGIELVNAFRRQYGAEYISVMPTNLYGPYDNFDLTTSHVLPALLRKMHEAKERNTPTVEIWGTGSPRREFLHVDDLAEACLFLMENYNDSTPINVGVGEDISIRELGKLIREVVGYNGDLVFNPALPDGMPRKLLDVSRINALGWHPRINLREGIISTYQWYLENLA